MPIKLNRIITLYVNSTNNKFIVASNKDDKKFIIDNKRLARRNEESKNYNKARNRLHIIHDRIKRKRNDLLHKPSRYYANRYNIIFVEELDVKNMQEDKALPNGNHTLHMNIADKAFNKFIQLLSYKTIIRINPKYTTKECYRCCSIKNMKLKDRIYKCDKCGLVIKR